jgi:hypothetical protein
MTRISSAGMWLAALALLTLAPTLGHADPRDVTVRWNPSPSEGVVRYVLSVGTDDESCMSDPDPITVTNPSVSGDVWSQIVRLEGSVNQHLALRAVDGEEQYSGFSNVIIVEALGTPGTPFVVDPH